MTDSPENNPEGPLARANARIHERHDEALLGLIERLTTLDVTGAREALEELSSDMARHLAVEDATTHPRYAGLEEHPRGAAPELFEADHVSHGKVMRSCEEALAALDPGDSNLRRAVVLILPLFYRLRNVLEHHTLREQRFLYPRLDDELEVSELQRLVEALSSPAGS